MIDLEISLARAFGWSLHEIDQTDIRSLLPFVSRLNQQKAVSSGGKKETTVHCDEVSWL